MAESTLAEKVVGGLHLASGLLVAGSVAAAWSLAAELAPLFEGSFVPGLVALFGKPIAIALLTVSGLQALAAAALLWWGRRWPRWILLGVSLLLLLVFPLGTALAFATAWVLLRPRSALPAERIAGST